MSKRYRPWKIDEPMLLPARVQEFVDNDHLARFVLSLVVEEIDLEEIERVYRVGRGQPPFDPAMMTALLLYGYCNGVSSGDPGLQRYRAPASAAKSLGPPSQAIRPCSST
jgi:hypothetical protein